MNCSFKTEELVGNLMLPQSFNLCSISLITLGTEFDHVTPVIASKV